MNIVCWCTGLQRVIPIRDQPGETLRNAYRNNWLRSHGRPRILVVDQQRSLCSGIFAEKVESDRTRLEVTPLEAPWRNGKTERAVKDWKEDFYKMTQDGPEAQTWTDFEDDCDAANQARASKINDSGHSTYQCVLGRNPPQMEDAILECGGADPGVESRQQTGELAQERSMTMRRLALQASLALDHKRRWKRAPQHAAKHNKGELHVGQPLWFWRHGANAAKKPTSAFLAPGRSHQQHVGHSFACIPPSASPASASPDTTHQEAEEDHDDKRRRIGERGSAVPTVAQDEVLTTCPVTFDSHTRNDEVAVTVLLFEETVEMSGETSQGWITEEAFFTVSPGARQVRQRKEVKMNQLSPAERHEFLKRMEVEWQTLLKNQAPEVLSLEETAQAQARWPDRAMDTRWAGT